MSDSPVNNPPDWMIPSPNQPQLTISTSIPTAKSIGWVAFRHGRLVRARIYESKAKAMAAHYPSANYQKFSNAKDRLEDQRQRVQQLYTFAEVFTL